MFHFWGSCFGGALEPFGNYLGSGAERCQEGATAAQPCPTGLPGAGVSPPGEAGLGLRGALSLPGELGSGVIPAGAERPPLGAVGVPLSQPLWQPGVFCPFPISGLRCVPVPL